MAALSPEELANLAETATVFAKVSPSQKAAIIDALHRKGHVVGFLGDGINDGPAEDCGRRHIRGQRRRHRQGIRGYHITREEPGGARRSRWARVLILATCSACWGPVSSCRFCR